MLSGFNSKKQYPKSSRSKERFLFFIYFCLMKKGVFFPYGISNFEKLSTQNYVFVDKTRYIEKLEKQQESYLSFLRPRRFGKSLFISILEYYYDIHQKHKFEKLFGKYYIGQNPTEKRNSYRILKFDFSGIDTNTPESTKQGFNEKVSTSILNFIIDYDCLKDKALKEKIFFTQDAEEVISKFFDFYDVKVPIYLLIDEYDHFTNEILYRSKEQFVNSVGKQGYIRKFYEVIKTATQQGVVDKVFITGVSPVTLDSLTSGFNILKHITIDEQFEGMMGFSEDEVRNLLNLVLEDKNHEKEIMNLMKGWYNGYRFAPKSNFNYYNSDMVLYFLDKYKYNQEKPLLMLDPNIAQDYYKIEQMFQVVDVNRNIKVLEEVLEKGQIAAELLTQFNFARGFTLNDFVNFLFYLGNLTIKDLEITGRIIFKIPNKVIEILYWQYYSKILEERASLLNYDSYDVQNAAAEMALQGKYEKFFEIIQRVIHQLSNRDFMKFNEKFVKMVIIAYLMQANIFDVISERETESGGYIDLMLLNKPANPPMHYMYAIELKYLKKEEEHLLEAKKQEAKEQLKNYYEKDVRLKSYEKFILLSVVCLKEDLFIEEVR